MFYESLSWLRRTRLHPATWRFHHERAWRIAMATLFSVQLACGYLLMLIAMTFQIELFVATVVGTAHHHSSQSSSPLYDR